MILALLIGVLAWQVPPWRSLFAQPRCLVSLRSHGSTRSRRTGSTATPAPAGRRRVATVSSTRPRPSASRSPPHSSRFKEAEVRQPADDRGALHDGAAHLPWVPSAGRGSARRPPCCGCSRRPARPALCSSAGSLASPPGWRLPMSIVRRRGDRKAGAGRARPARADRPAGGDGRGRPRLQRVAGRCGQALPWTAAGTNST